MRLDGIRQNLVRNANGSYSAPPLFTNYNLQQLRSLAGKHNQVKTFTVETLLSLAEGAISLMEMEDEALEALGLIFPSVDTLIINGVNSLDRAPSLESGKVVALGAGFPNVKNLYMQRLCESAILLQLTQAFPNHLTLYTSLNYLHWAQNHWLNGLKALLSEGILTLGLIVDHHFMTDINLDHHDSHYARSLKLRNRLFPHVSHLKVSQPSSLLLDRPDNPTPALSVDFLRSIKECFTHLEQVSFSFAGDPPELTLEQLKLIMLTLQTLKTVSFAEGMIKPEIAANFVIWLKETATTLILRPTGFDQRQNEINTVIKERMKRIKQGLLRGTANALLAMSHAKIPKEIRWQLALTLGLLKKDESVKPGQFMLKGVPLAHKDIVAAIPLEADKPRLPLSHGRSDLWANVDDNFSDSETEVDENNLAHDGPIPWGVPRPRLDSADDLETRVPVPDNPPLPGGASGSDHTPPSESSCLLL